MPKISKSKKATLAQGENEEPKSVRKRVTQKRQKAFLSDENSSPSGPTPNNNLDGSTNSKVLARASWADPMDPSDQAAISDAGKVPSGKKGDFTASTSKRSTPARNAKGRWSRNTRSGRTRADMQDESKDNQSDGNSQLIINQDIVAGTAGFINDDTNGCHAYALHSGIPTKEQNSELTIQCGSQSYRKKAAPGKNLSTNWLEEASVRQTVGLVTESNSRTELGTNKTIKKDCELPTQSGFLRTRKKAAQDFITESNSTTDCEQKNIIKKKVQDSELPLKRCSSRKKAAPDFITESNSCIEFGPNKPIKKEVHVSELPLQKGSSRTKAAPDFNSKPNSWSEFSPNKTVKKGGQDSQLPHQSVSQSSGKKAAPELNSCSKIGPNKTIKKEVHVSQLPIQSNSHRFRKKIAPEVNLWTYFNQNTIVKKEMQDSKLPLQRGSQSSWKNAAQESSSNKTIKKEVQDSKLPIQSGSQSSRKKTATQLISCTDFDQNKIIKMEVHNSELPLQRGTSRKKAATESSLWTELAPSTTIKNEVQNSEVPTQSGSQGSRKKAASESMSRTDFNKNQIIKQEVLDSELPIQWGSKSPSKNAAPESSSNKSIKKAVQNSEVPIQNGSQGFRKKAATQSSLWTELALNTTIKKEVQNSEVPIQSGSQSSRKKAATDFITELNLCTDFDQNQIIKKEVQDFELPIQWGSQSPRKNAAPESSSSTEFCPYKTIKKEVQDFELPIQSGSQSFRRKASTESSLWTEFSPSKTIKKEVQDSEVPNQSGSQSSWQKAATDLIAELNSLTEFSPNKTIKKEVQNSNVPIQCGSQSSRKKGASDFTKEMNSCTDFDQNKIIKREVHISELPLHRGSSRKKAATESISCTDFDQNQIIKQEVLDSELPIQWGSQSPRKNAAPESSLWTEFDQIQIIKKEVQDSELPIQWASQSRRQDAAPESSSWTEFDQIQIIKNEVQDSELPIQWASQSRRQSAAPNFITDSSLWTEFSPNKTIKKEVQDSEVPDQSGSQSSWQKAATDLIAELNSWTELAPNKTIKKEVQDSELPLQKGSQSPTKKAAHCTDLRTNLLEEDFAGPPIDFLAESNSWTSVRPNMFIEEKGMGPELPLDWFADESFCNWLGADAGVGSNNDEVAAELSSGIPISEEIKPQLRAPTNNRDRMRQAEDDASSAYKKPYQPAENKDIGFIKPKTSLGAADAFSRLLSNQDDDGLSFDVASKHFAKNDGSDNSKEDDIDARLGAELASLFSGEETMPKRSSKKPEEASVSETEAEIDARLQAELDSLPLVEVPEEADKSLDDLLNSLLNSDQQTAEASTAVGSQVFPSGNLQLPTAPQSTAANKAIGVINPVTHQIPQPVAGNYQRPLSQVPMVAHVTGLQGQVVSLTYTTAPDGLVTSVSTSSTKLPLAQPTKKVNELESLTASQLHQILQSGQPYLALPMIVPGGPGAGDLRPRDAAGIVSPTGQAVEDEEVDYEEIGVADTFAEYWPSKLKFGMAHPDPVVETATLSSVELPDITYQLALPQRTTSCLSALQLEAVIYACQAHEQILPSGERAGFLLGDGAGVGKGRTIAGIIFDNYMKGRKRALWVSVSNDLKFDAERDLYDIGAHDRVHVVAINKFKYSRIDSEENENFKKGVIFCTYTALIGESLTANSKYKTRLRQLVHWFGKKFDGVIVFDECHKAKNLSLMNVGKSTKTGTTVLDLQKLLPHARVVYASATGASEPRNMAYMVRLGLWGPGTAYPEFFEFVNAVEKRGIGAMEIVAMDMKLRGTYIARQLSFKDVSFRIEEVPMPKEFRKTYNLAAELWAEINKKFLKACRLMCIENRVQKIITCQFWCAHQRFFKNLCIASKVNHVVKMTRQATRMGKAVVIGLQSTGESRTLEHLERHNGRLSSFVSTSKMIIQSFVEKHFPAPKRDSFHRLLNTGEFEPEPRFRPPRPKKAKMSSDWFDDDMDAEAGESDIEMYESSLSVDDDRAKTGRKRRGRPPKAEKVEKITMQERILQHLCNNMRAQDNDGDATYTFDNTKLQKANITEHDVERCIRARELLLDKIEILGRRMPSNTLDKLISELGGTKLVAEMTGRRGRVVRTEYDGYKYEPRCESDTSMDLVNYREKQRFMVGSKHVAIISEAASSGISLQSDKRVSNQRRRLHITLELPWSADRAIQQFGRTHRSNQVNSPEYVFVITDLAGERRFASTVAKRLESLGALTQGDRRATDARDLSQFNIDNSIGRSALENVMQQLTGEKPLDHSYVPASYKGDFLYDCSVAMAGVGMLNVREENKVKLFSVEKDSNNISKFLNRILGCRVEVQNALFKFFLDKMYSLIMQMKRTGHFDLGILDLDAHGACVKSVKLMRFVRKHATGTAATELHTVTVERGMSYETALAKYRKEGRHEHDGFYVLQQLRHNKNSSILCLQAKSSTTEAATSAPGKVSLQLYRPNTGPQVRLETLSSILTRYVKVEPEAARDFWQQQYDVCLDRCSHVYWNRACPFPAGCEVGLRVRPYHVLSGLMLPIWDRIELILEKSGHKIQIIRVKTDVNKKIVGTVVPHGVYDALVADLSSDSIVESH